MKLVDAWKLLEQMRFYRDGDKVVGAVPTSEIIKAAAIGTTQKGKDMLKIGDEVYIHGYVDEIRPGTIIIRNDGGYFGTIEDEIRKGIADENEKDERS